MKKIISVILLSLIPLGLYSQKTRDYYQTDSATVIGVKLIGGRDENNCQFVSVKRGKEIVKLFPDEVREYGFADGRIYFSKELNIDNAMKRVFLEKLVDGKMTLYYYKGKSKLFFMERDSIFSELTKRDASGRKHYRETLQALGVDCEYTGSFARRTWYNRYYMKRFGKRYYNCMEIYRPVRFGIVGGWDFTGYSMLKDAWGIESIPTGSFFTFGAFADIPILQSRVSFHPEIFYLKQAYSLIHTLSESNLLEKECITNIESYSIPLLIRYTWWKGKWNPYMNLGMTWQHYSRLENSVFTAIISSGILYAQKIEPKLSPSKNAIMGGVGVWCKINRRNAVFVEARTVYNKYKYTYNIFAGINF